MGPCLASQSVIEVTTDEERLSRVWPTEQVDDKLSQSVERLFRTLKYHDASFVCQTASPQDRFRVGTIKAKSTKFAK